jgi:glycosyltransferase involved in cell wall biosynthesis
VDPCPPVAEVEEGRFRIFALGRLVPKKGFDVLLRAVARLRDQGLAFHCTLGGDGPERDRLQEIIREESLEACVTLPGSIANRDLPRWLGGADVLVLPCRIDADGDRDGIPVVLMEAMSAGICVVSGDLPAIRELVEEGVTGRLIAPGDVGALVTVLESLAADPDQRRELGARGRKRVEEEFSTGVNIDRLLLSFRRFA